MSIFNKTFENIEFSDIEELIINQISEKQNLEYKKEVWGKSDDDIREMLRDITSIANAYGGYIILGIDEDEEGQAKEICHIENEEKERDRIFSSCLSNIDPRIPALNIKTLSKEKKHVILLNVPKSLRSPHMINFKGLNQFWIRHDRQKIKMSVEEIKDNFLKTEHWLIKAETFIEKRKRSIISKIQDNSFMIIGALPLGVLNENFVDISDYNLKDKLKTPPNERSAGFNFTFDYTTPCPSYFGLKIGCPDDSKTIELHRNGYLEGKSDFDFIEENRPEYKDKKIINGCSIVELIHSFLKQAKQLKEYFGYEGQYLIHVSFLNIRDYFLGKNREDNFFHNTYLQKWNDKNLEFEPFIFEDVDPDKIGKRICDRIWQAFGYESEPYYKDGKLDLK